MTSTPPHPPDRGWSRRFALTCLIALAVWGSGLDAGWAQGGDLATRASGFVQTLGQRAIAIMAEKGGNRDRQIERYRALLHEDFDLSTISRFALGHYWASANPAQQREYLRQFEEMVVRGYAARFDAYDGQSLRVLSSRRDGEDVFVDSEILQPKGPPVHLEWRVRQRDGHLGIIDVVVEGVSMSVTQRQEFSSVIQAKGGNFDAFLQALREKNAAMASGAAAH